MSRRVTILTFRQWLIKADGKASQIDAAGDQIIKSTANSKAIEGQQAWCADEKMLELAMFTKDAIETTEIAILHHAHSYGNPLYRETRREFAVAGLDDTAMAVAVNTMNIGHSGEVKIPTNKNLLECDSEEKLKNLEIPSRTTPFLEIELPNVLVFPPFIFAAIA